MKQKQLFEKEKLIIEVEEGETEIEIFWRGSASERNPGDFIIPILSDVLNKSNKTGKKIKMDFRHLEYMNSSTIVPIIKILERAKRGENRVVVLYNNTIKWQKLNFTALEIFQTDDQRIQISGKAGE